MSLWRVERKAVRGNALTVGDLKAFLAEAEREGALDGDRLFGTVSMTAKLRQIAVEIPPGRDPGNR
ncbi:hypothetical protein [Streptomyces sp. Z26]|uniref:hypothetical protein n=1 Tax=Streptomyces TaxID=1883 RepID=UPI000EF172B6|nr:hypothetical protein [Streptomyces sp. Z26]RLL65723.1 hypothetical protein D7M15_01095 [Streptomyces sp. Z26]